MVITDIIIIIITVTVSAITTVKRHAIQQQDLQMT